MIRNMKKLLFIIAFSFFTIALNAVTRTYYAYVPTYMYSLGTVTISYDSYNVDIYYQGENMRCDVLKTLTTEEGDIYLLHNKKENTYWILALSESDGCLFKSNSSFSLRNMKMYLSSKKIQR